MRVEHVYYEDLNYRKDVFKKMGMRITAQTDKGFIAISKSGNFKFIALHETNPLYMSKK